MKKTIVSAMVFFCSLGFQIEMVQAAPTPPPPCPGGICEIDPPAPANRLAKIDLSLGFGARSFYEIPNYSYLTDSVSIVVSIADQGLFQFDQLMHGMNPAKTMTLILKGRDRRNAQTMTVTNPEGRFWTTSCYSQPADACYLSLESAWVSVPPGGPYDIRHVSKSGRYLVKVYYDGGIPTKTLTFRTP